MNKSFIMAAALILALIGQSNGYAITDSNQQQIILGKHNEVRRLAAQGSISKYGFSTAAKMYPLTWDNTLANTAERLAKTCDFNHNTFGTGNGQNIAMGGGGNNVAGIGVPDEQPKGTPDGCSNCFSSDEEAIKFLQYGWITGSNEQTDGPNTNNHFTQMVDDDTFRVGCALNNKCGGSFGPYYLVCNYDPAGNNGNAVYTVGATGSQCPKGSSNGLCLGTTSTVTSSTTSTSTTTTSTSTTQKPTTGGSTGPSVEEICGVNCGFGESFSCNNGNGVRKVSCTCTGKELTFTYPCPSCECW